MRKASRIAAYGVVLACLFLQYYFYRNKGRAKASATSIAAHLVGSHVRLDSKKPELVIALTTRSVFGRASSPFYRRLLEDVIPGLGTEVKTVAIVPEPKRTAEQYLEEILKLKFNEGAPELLGIEIPATPTLLLVDRAGRVDKAWVGFLQPETELEVVKALHAIAD